MDQRSLNSHKNNGHSPFFLPPIMRSSVGQCRNIRFRQLYASHVIITSVTGREKLFLSFHRRLLLIYMHNEEKFKVTRALDRREYLVIVRNNYC